MGYLRASLHTDKLSGSVGRGITVETNDPENPKVFLTVRATVVGSVILLPHASMSIIDAASPNQRRMLLVRQEPTETGQLAITDLRASVPWLGVEATRLDNPRPAANGLPAAKAGDWLLEVSLTGTFDYGRHQETVTFKTGLPRQPEISVPVQASARPPVHLSVNQLKMPVPAGDAPATATVVVAVRRGLDPETLVARAEPDALQVELEPNGDRFFKAHVTWSGEDFSGGAVEFEVSGRKMRLPVVPAD